MPKLTIKKITENRFFSSFIVLCSGSIWAQAIAFLCSLLLTRIYLPYDLGILTYVLSLSTMFTSVICGRYDVRIVDAPKEEVAALVRLSFLITCAASIVITAGIYLYLLVFGERPEILRYAWYCFFVLFLYGIMNTLNAYNNRMEEYKIMSGVYVLRAIFQNIFMLLLGVLHCGAFGLLTGQVAGYLAGMRLQSKSLRRENILRERTTWSDLARVGRKNIHMFTYSVPSTFVNALSYSVLSVGIGQLFGMIELGYYCISVRVLGLPLTVFSSNISRLHYRNSIRDIETRGNYFRCTVRTLFFALLIILPIMGFLILSAPFLFSLLFGEQWERSGRLVQILALMFTVRFLMGSIGFSFIIAEKQSLEFLFQLMLFAGFLISFILTKIHSLSIESFLLLIMALYSFVYLCEITTSIVLSKKGKKTSENCASHPA